jgi:hypothetical protein
LEKWKDGEKENGKMNDGKMEKAISHFHRIKADIVIWNLSFGF